MRNKKWLAPSMAILLLAAFFAACAPAGSELETLPPIKFLSGDSELAKKSSIGLQEIVRDGMGIELTLENVDFTTRFDRLRNGDFALVLAGWGADYNDPASFLDMWVTGSPYNDIGWSNQEYDNLMAQARASSAPVERMELMGQAEKILLDDAPIIPIYWPQRNYAEHAWVKNIVRPAVGPQNDWKFAYTEKRPGGDNRLALNLGEEPLDLQSITTTDEVSFDIINATLEGMARLGPDGNFEMGSGLAKSWNVSEDGKTYTFTLRDGLKWSDGTPLTANDFEYAWKKAVDPRTASPYNYMLFNIVGAEDVANIVIPDKDTDPAGYDDALSDLDAALDAMGVEATDDRTLVVSLVAPSNVFINLTAFATYMPLNRAAHEKWGDQYATEVEKMLYCGPFVIKEWSHDSKMVLVKNPNHWDADNVKITEITFHMIKDINTPVSMYEAGQLDAINVPGDFIPKFQAERPTEFHQMPNASAWYLECNLENDVMKNPAFRKALSLAIDRKAFCDDVLRNFSAPATSLTPPSINGATPDEVFSEKYVGRDYLPPTGNPEEAKELLKQALKELGYALPE